MSSCRHVIPGILFPLNVYCLNYVIVLSITVCNHSIENGPMVYALVLIVFLFCFLRIMHKLWWMQTGHLCSLWTTEQMNCMPEYLTLAAVLKTAAPPICKRKSGGYFVND